MRKLECRREALFQYRGLPPVGMAVSMALQHLVAMIVGCVTPAIIIANDPRKKENLQKLLENHAGKFKVVERKGQNFLEVLRAELSGMITK